MALSLDEADHFGIRHDETTGPRDPETENLDRLFGFRQVTAAGRRILEADPGVMDLLEGGEVVDRWFERAVGPRVGLYCLACRAGR